MDFNVKHKTPKPLQKNIRENFQDLELDKDFLQMRPKYNP